MKTLLSNLVDVIKDKEVDCGGAPPRVLVLDDYFMTEVEKVEKDPDTGRRVKTKVSLTCNNNKLVLKWCKNIPLEIKFSISEQHQLADIFQLLMYTL